MCLDTVDKKPTVTEGEGWKAFSIHRGVLTATCMGTLMPEGKWLKDRNKRPIACGSWDSKKTYPPGFHIARSKSGTRGWGGNVRKVSFRNVVATGAQGGDGYTMCRYIVAREIYIHPKR